MIEETIRSQAPNKVLLPPPPPPIDPAEQLLPRSFRSALPQLRSGHCSRHQAYRHSVGRADDPTCPDCCSTDNTVAHLFSCPTHPTDLAPGDMWTAPLQVSQFMAGLPPVQRPAPIAGRLCLLPSLTLIPAVGRLFPDHQRDHIILTSPFTALHLTCGPGVASPPAIQQQQQPIHRRRVQKFFHNPFLF